MLKRTVSIMLVFLLVLALSSPAYCDDPIKKLGRGIANMLTFPLEIPLHIRRVNDEEGTVAAVTYGLVKGLAMSLYRAFIGIYETATFTVPLPPSYKPILTDPEFFFEDKSIW